MDRYSTEQQSVNVESFILENVYIPTAHELLLVEEVTEIEWLFRVKYDKEVKAGQFIQVSIPRVGEAPISIANFNKEEGKISNEEKNSELKEKIQKLSEV